MFPRYRAANASINPRKSPLLMRVQKMLGHVVSEHSISRSPELIDKFTTMFKKIVTTSEDLERNLAAIQWLSKFIPALSDKGRFMMEKLRGWKGEVKPMMGVKGRQGKRMTSKEYVFEWGLEDQEKMLELITDIRMNIVLQVFNPTPPVIMMFDASPWAILCVIGQLTVQDKKELAERGGNEIQEEKVEETEFQEKRIVRKNTKKSESLKEKTKPLNKRYKKAVPTIYLSKVLNPTQERWAQTEKEAFAIYYFTLRNRHLLYGVKIYFFTDCQCLTFIHNEDINCTGCVIEGT